MSFGRHRLRLLSNWYAQFASSLVVTALSLALPPGAAAQAPLGGYVGSATIAGQRPGRIQVTYKAQVKISLPITQDDRSLIVAEQFGGPPVATAKVTITQWDVKGSAGSPGADGKIRTWTCQLTAPTEFSASVSGVLRVDRRKGTQESFFALLPNGKIPLDCTPSSGAPYKEERAEPLFLGTSEASLVPYATQPAPNPDRLKAKFVYVPVAEAKATEGPISFEWELVRTR